jgi:hypothetical protein
LQNRHTKHHVSQLCISLFPDQRPGDQQHNSLREQDKIQDRESRLRSLTW